MYVSSARPAPHRLAPLLLLAAVGCAPAQPPGSSHASLSPSALASTCDSADTGCVPTCSVELTFPTGGEDLTASGRFVYTGDCDGYRLELSPDADFPAYDTIYVTRLDAAATTPLVLPATAWANASRRFTAGGYARILGGIGDEVAVSSVTTFSTTGVPTSFPPPAATCAVALVEPSDGAAVGGEPTFRWSSTCTAARLEFSADAKFPLSGTVAMGSFAGNTATLDAARWGVVTAELPLGGYWRVVGGAADGEHPSMPHSFTVGGGTSCDADGDGHQAASCGGDDCDDADAAIGAPATWFRDYDSDGWGNYEDAAVACDAPAGWIATYGDCVDTDATINPDATERCDAEGVDEDCDGVALVSLVAEDFDGYGNGASASGWSGGDMQTSTAVSVSAPYAYRSAGGSGGPDTYSDPTAFGSSFVLEVELYDTGSTAASTQARLNLFAGSGSSAGLGVGSVQSCGSTDYEVYVTGTGAASICHSGSGIAERYSTGVSRSAGFHHVRVLATQVSGSDWAWEVSVDDGTPVSLATEHFSPEVLSIFHDNNPGVAVDDLLICAAE